MKVKPDVFSSSGSHDNGSVVDNATPAAVATPGKGLSELVRLCVGRPLDKQQQLSDWERRPLRLNQIVYAGNVALPVSSGSVPPLATVYSLTCRYILWLLPGTF